MNIIDISKIFECSPCRVIYRLLESGESIESICGYTEYSKTDEYMNYIRQVITDEELQLAGSS